MYRCQLMFIFMDGRAFVAKQLQAILGGCRLRRLCNFFRLRATCFFSKASLNNLSIRVVDASGHVAINFLSGTIILWQHLVPLSALKLHCVQPVARTKKTSKQAAGAKHEPGYSFTLGRAIQKFALLTVILYKILGEKHLFQHTKTC